MKRITLWGTAAALLLLLALPATAAAPASWRAGTGVSGSFTVLHAASADVAYAAGPQRSLMRTADGGRSWSALTPPSSGDVRAVESAGPDTVFALDSFGTLSRSRDDGATWTPLSLGAAVFPAAVLTVGRQGVLVAARHALLLSRDGGDTFTPVTPKPERRDSFRQLDAAGAAVLAYGPQTLLISRDSAASWKRLSLPKLAHGDTLLKADFVDGRRGYLLTAFRRLYKTRDAGLHWQELLGAAGAGADISFSDARHGLLAAPGFANRFDGYVLYTEDGGQSWRPEAVSSRFVSTVAASGGTGYVIGNEGSALFAGRLGGERGRALGIRFHRIKPKVKRGELVRIRGRISPAIEGVYVTASLRSGRRWQVRYVRTNAIGVFRARFSTRRRAWAVVQVAATAGHGSAATKPVFLPFK